jgi:hypothetical protein
MRLAVVLDEHLAVSGVSHGIDQIASAPSSGPLG